MNIKHGQNDPVSKELKNGHDFTIVRDQHIFGYVYRLNRDEGNRDYNPLLY